MPSIPIDVNGTWLDIFCWHKNILRCDKHVILHQPHAVILRHGYNLSPADTQEIKLIEEGLKHAKPIPDV